MCTIISSFCMQQKKEQANDIVLALEHVTRTIWKTDEPDEDFMNGIAHTISSLAKSVSSLAEEFELLSNWAEDANIQIVHQRFYGKGTRLDVNKADPEGPEVLLTSTKVKTKGV